MKKLSREECKNIADVMRSFDFRRVHAIMTLIEWKWVTPAAMAGTAPMSDISIPSVARLRETAKHLLIDACQKGTVIATGGFEAECDSDGNLTLKFILVESSVDAA